MIDQCPADTVWCVLSVIVNHEQGSRVLKIARQNGISGGTIFLGHGTAGNRFQKWGDADDIRKEIVMMIAPLPVAEQTIDQLNQIIKLDRPNHGIAFIMTVAHLLGSSACSMAGISNPGGAETTMQQAIFVIVNKGEAETVVGAAEKVGARGATVVNGRGAGVHETSRLFSMEIEPEKEIVLIIVQREVADAVMKDIVESARLNEPGNGILFAVDVQYAQGLFA